MKKLNNLNFLRLIFAIFVIITHSFPITGTQEEFEPLINITKGQLSFSFLGLKGFFVLSGFLIYKSFERSITFFEFILKRVLRIFPALFFMSFVIVFILGITITDYSFGGYFSNKNVYTYFIQSITLINFGLLKCLPGIFEKNILGCELNGSLWTISYEFLFYLSFLFVYIFKKNKLFIKILFLISYMFFYYVKFVYVDKYFVYDIHIPNTTIGFKAIIDFGLYFLMGSIFSIFNLDELMKNKETKILLISLSIIVITLVLNIFSYVSYIIYPAFILSIGLMSFQICPYYSKLGDISYGVYLWAFPIQQLLEYNFKLLPAFNIIFSIILVIPLGFLSWNIIENPFMKLKYTYTLK